MDLKGKNLKLLFYILTAYTLLAFGWWGYLLWQKNEEAYIAVIQREIIYFNYVEELSEEAFFQSEEFNELKNKHQRQRFMILGEGIVLFILLLLGIWRLKHTLYKEVELARRQKNFLLSVTHELKSPLASVKLGLETLKRHYKSDEKPAKVLDGCLEETNRLDILVNNILVAARLDNNAYKPEIEPIKLASSINRIAEKVSTQYKHSHTIKSNIDESIMLETDEQILSSVMINLLENAHKYAPDGSTIFLSNKIVDDTLHLLVRDEGSGIPEKEQKKIFEKFYRSGNEETRNSKGTGLGLYIVKSLLQLVKAEIDVHTHAEKGAVFRIIFPPESWRKE